MRSAKQLAQTHNVQMPITDIVYRILYEGLPPRKGLYEAMNRERKPEPEEYFFKLLP